MVRPCCAHQMHLPAVLYVGAGTDLPLPHIPPSHRLVCVDGQPFSEFGIERCNCRDCHNCCNNCFARPRFVAKLDESARRMGLGGPHVDGNVREYGSRLRYHTSTSVPEHMERLRHESPCTALLVRGHHPHRTVMNLLAPRGNAFLGFPGTSYRFDAEDKETVVHLLHTCETARARFRVFTLLHDETTRIHCADWWDFVRHSQTKR